MNRRHVAKKAAQFAIPYARRNLMTEDDYPNKVFCQDCAHFSPTIYVDMLKLKVPHCTHGDCWEDSPIEPAGKRIHDYDTLNAKNDCHRFEQGETK